jgi:hypothetical protein
MPAHHLSVGTDLSQPDAGASPRQRPDLANLMPAHHPGSGPISATLM